MDNKETKEYHDRINEFQCVLLSSDSACWSYCLNALKCLPSNAMKDERWFINLGHPFSRALFSVFSIDVLPSRGPCSFFISSLLTLEAASSSHPELLKLIDNAKVDT
ncbi:hypothetical protein KQX54_017411 [Cotesia glomerata]|uniref:Uncharacterized protein n=1 Tax=Cotesia glomerata TaxID=32391 RepID=A0AAV7IG83_COTGL|nr:hypothetical protein KQX54_017411 [Cotesia glomerata]